MDDFTHSVRSRALVVEHLRWPSCAEVPGREPHSVSKVESNLHSAAVLRLALLGLHYDLTEISMSLCQSLEHSIHLDLRFQVRRFQCIELQLRVRMVHGPERCHPSRSIHWVIVCEICQRKAFDPVVLLIVAEGSEVLFHGLFLLVGVAVRQRVEEG